MPVVYKISTSDTHGNYHQINRDETWFIHQDKQFDSKEEAKEYIRKKTRLFIPKLTICLINLPEEKKHSFCDKFCFTDDRYITHRRYFLGYPNLNNIKQHLKKSGVIIQQPKKFIKRLEPLNNIQQPKKFIKRLEPLKK